MSVDFNATKSNFRATNRNFSMNVQKRLPPKIPYKDPDIWDPPESLQKNVSNPKISKPVSRASKNFNVSKPNTKGSIKKIKK